VVFNSNVYLFAYYSVLIITTYLYTIAVVEHIDNWAWSYSLVII